MRELPAERVVSVAHLAAAGWTQSAVRNAVRRGRLVRVRRGWYAAAPDDLSAVHAAAGAYPDGVVSHRSAALLHGLPLIGARPALPVLTFPPVSSGNRPGAKVHRARLRAQDVALASGILTTSVARTLVDEARHEPVARSVALIDAALHRQMVTYEEIDEVVRFCWNWPGIRRAQRALRHSDGRSESPLESVSRLVIGWVGLPVPSLQKIILDQYGRFVGRGDFYWDEFGVVGEADGRSKYDGRDVLFAEKERQEALENLRVVVTRWGWTLPTRRPHAFRSRIEEAFARGQARDRSGLPRLWTL